MIQGDSSASDVIFGMAVLAVALPVLYFIGKVITGFERAKFERAWRPLKPVLADAKSVSESGTSGVLTGTYRGTSVFAKMTPNMGTLSPDGIGGGRSDGGYVNQWETGVRDLTGASDWTLRWRLKNAFLGFDTPGWVVICEDPELAARLERAGVREIVAPIRHGEIVYETQSATLVLHQDLRPLLAPPPEGFRLDLDVLLKLAAVAGPLN